jgi:hypothetical protein
MGKLFLNKKTTNEPNFTIEKQNDRIEKVF